MTTVMVEKIKTTDGRLFDSNKFGPEEAKKYDDSYQRLQIAIDGLGKEPEHSYPERTCVRITQESLDIAIKIFTEECKLWMPESTEKFNKPNICNFHETFIARVISDTDELPSNLNTLCYILCSIDTKTLLRYDQIWSKNNPSGIEIKG